MVGRLVHDIEIRFRCKDSGKGYPLGFSSRELGHLLFQVEKAEIREKLAKPELEGSKGVMVGDESGQVCHSLFHYRLFRVEIRFLRQKGDADVFKEGDFSARVRLVLTSQDSQKRGLAGPVWRNEGHFVSFVDIKTDVVEEHLRSVRLRNPFNLKITCHI